MFVVGFESIFEKRLRLGKLCNDSRFYKNAYKVLDFWKYFMFWKRLVCLKRCLFWRWIVSKQLRMFYLLKSLLFISLFPLTLLSYHWLVRILIFGCKGTGVDHRIVIKCNVMRYLSIFLKGLRSFVRKHSKRHRGNMILYFLLFLLRRLTCITWPFSIRQQMGLTLGCMCE